MNSSALPLLSTPSLIPTQSIQPIHSTTPHGHYYHLHSTPHGLTTVILLTILAILLVSCTLIGNTLVCLAVVLVRKLRSQPANYLLVSLAVADMCVGAFVMPLAFVYLLLGRWEFGQFMCDVWTSADVTLCTASILSLCAISVDRYSAITRPLSYGPKRTSRRMLVYVLLVWIMAVLVSFLPPIAFWKPSENGKCTVTDNVGYQIYATMASFFIPGTIILVVNYKIFKAARRLTLADKRAYAENSTTSFVVKHPQTSVSCPGFVTNNDHKSLISPETTLRSASANLREIASVSTTNNCAKKCAPVSRLLSLEKKMSFVDVDYNSSETQGSEEAADLEGICEKTRRKIGWAVGREVAKPPIDRPTDQPRKKTSTVSFQAPDPMHSTRYSFPRFDNDLHDSRRSSSSSSSIDRIDRLRSIKRSIIARLAKLACVPCGGKFKFCKLRRSNRPGEYSPKPIRHRRSIDDHPDRCKQSQSNSSPARSINRPKRRQKKHQHHYRSNNSETRAMKTLGLIMGCFLLCWIPFFTVTLIRALFCSNSNCFVPGWVESLVLWLGYANSTLNPLLYAKYNKDFRIPFREMLCCRFSTLQSVLRMEEYLETFGSMPSPIMIGDDYAAGMAVSPSLGIGGGGATISSSRAESTALLTGGGSDKGCSGREDRTRDDIRL